MRRVLALTAAILTIATGASAQQKGELIDRIAAVVNGRAILVSDVDEQLLIRWGDRIPTDSTQRAALFRNMLDEMINEEIVVQEAKRDTAIKVTDEEVAQTIDAQYKSIRSRFESEEQFRTELRNANFRSVEDWRAVNSELQRRQFYWRRFWDRVSAKGDLKPLPPTDAEIKEAFEARKGSYRQRPEGVSFLQIVVAPRPSAVARAAALAQADSILAEIRKGADFAVAARRFSADTASREQGGSLGWVRRGSGYDPKFEAAAFSLRIGQVSDPVETSFGFHLIQVERAQAVEVSVRHILIRAVIDSVQADSARALAEAIRQAGAKGAAFDSLQRLYHDPVEEREANQFPIDSLPKAYAEAVKAVKVGEVTAIIPLASDPTRTKYAVVKVTNRFPAGEARLEDERDRLRSDLAEQLARRRYLDKLKKRNYVQILLS